MLNRKHYLKISKVVVSCLLLVLISQKIIAQEDNWEHTLKKYESYTDDLIKQSKQAYEEWKSTPTTAKQNKYNDLYQKSKDSIDNLYRMQVSIREAKTYSTSIETLKGSFDTLGGAISDISTRIFGMTDEEFFGPNWQNLTLQYQGMSERYKEIIKKKNELKNHPYNEQELLDLEKEIKEMRETYDVLRKAIRTDQKLNPSFWGDDYAGKYIEVTINNFDIKSLIQSYIFTGTAKVFYDLIKPAFISYLGSNYVIPNGNLTRDIADSIVLEVMNPSLPLPERLQEDISGYLAGEGGNKVNNFIFDKLRTDIVKEATTVIDDESIRLIQSLSYQELQPQSIQTAVRRTLEQNSANYSQKIHEASKKLISKGLDDPLFRKEVFSNVLNNTSIIVDFSKDIGGLINDWPLAKQNLTQANDLLGKYREDYKQLINNKIVDEFDGLSEEQYLNYKWFSQSKVSLAQSQKIAKANVTETELILKSQKNLKNEKKENNENLVKNNTINFVFPEELVNKFKKSVDEVITNYESRNLDNDGFIAAYFSARSSVGDILQEVNSNNYKIYLDELKKIESDFNYSEKKEALVKLYNSHLEKMTQLEKNFNETHKSYMDKFQSNKVNKQEELKNLNSNITNIIREYETYFNSITDELDLLFNNIVKITEKQVNIDTMESIYANLSQEIKLYEEASQKSLLEIDSKYTFYKDSLNNLKIASEQLKEPTSDCVNWLCLNINRLEDNYDNNTPQDIINFEPAENKLDISYDSAKVRIKKAIENCPNYFLDDSFFTNFKSYNDSLKKMQELYDDISVLYEKNRKNGPLDLYRTHPTWSPNLIPDKNNIIPYLYMKFSDSKSNYLPPNLQLVTNLKWPNKISYEDIELQLANRNISQESVEDTLMNFDKMLSLIQNINNLKYEINKPYFSNPGIYVVPFNISTFCKFGFNGEIMKKLKSNFPYPSEIDDLWLTSQAKRLSFEKNDFSNEIKNFLKGIDDLKILYNQKEHNTANLQIDNNENSELSFEEKKSIITNFYLQIFKQAYESRNEGLLISYLSDEWEAPDGSTISDVEETFRRVFSIFDSIKINIVPLLIKENNDKTLDITYSIDITGNIYSKNLTHKEKAQIVERVTFDDKKNVKILKTIQGTYWTMGY